MTAMSSGVEASAIKVTVENLAPTDGLHFTPVYSAFHNGSFDIFNVGAAASPGLEAAAELGDFSTIDGERLGSDAASVGGVITAPGGFAGAPIFEPGETDFTVFVLDPTVNRFFSFLAMILPSNDTFIANDDAAAVEVFSAAGKFLGPQTIIVLGQDIYDAGTEVNDPAGGPAFVPGQDATVSPAQGGTVQLSPGLGVGFAGLLLPNGQTLDGDLIDFQAALSTFQVARITIEEIPEPSTLALLLTAAFGAGAMRLRRRRRSAAATVNTG